MTYNILLDGSVHLNETISDISLTSSGVSLLVDNDSTTSAFTVSSGTCAFDCNWGDPYYTKNVKYYLSNIEESTVSGSYGLSSYTESSFVAVSSGTFYYSDINSNLRYLRLHHTASGTSDVYEIDVEGESNDILYFSSFDDYGTVYYSNTPIGTQSSSAIRIGITNSGTVSATAAVSVAPTTSGSDDYFLLSDNQMSGFLPRRLSGFAQPVFAEFSMNDDTLISSNLSQWNVVHGSKSYIYSDSSGLNIVFDGYSTDNFRINSGITGATTGIVSKESFSGSQSFTINIKVKITALTGGLYTPNGIFFGVSNTWPIPDSTGGNTSPINRSFNRKGRTAIGAWVGTKGTSDIYVGSLKIDENYDEFLTEFDSVGDIYSALASAVKLEDFTEKTTYGQTMLDGTSEAVWRTMSVSYDHLNKRVRVFFDDVELNSFTIGTSSLLETFNVFAVYAGKVQSATIVLKEFSSRKDFVKLSGNVPYTSSTFSSSDTQHMSSNMNDGQYGGDIGEFSWISGSGPVSGDSISFTLSGNNSITGVRSRYPTYVSISGSVFGNPQYYVDLATITFNTGDIRYLYMDGEATPNINGWEVRKFITSSGTVEPVYNVSSGTLQIVNVGTHSVSSPLPVLAIDELEFLSDAYTSVSPTVAFSGTGSSWASGMFLNAAVKDYNLALSVLDSSKLDVSSAEVCELLRRGIDYNISSPAFSNPETNEFYHYAESVFKIKGRGGGDRILASTSSGSDAWIWRRLSGRVRVGAVLFSLYSEISGSYYKGKPDKWKLQYLVNGGDPSNESDWINIPVITTTYPTVSDYKKYRDYLITNNDGEFYTYYLNIYGDTGTVPLPSETLLLSDSIDHGILELGTFSGVVDIYVEFDEVIETEAIRVYIKDGYNDTLRSVPASGYSFYKFVVLSDTQYFLYESPVVDTEFSLNSEKIFTDIETSGDNKVLYRTSDTSPDVSFGNDYERWEDLGAPFSSLNYGITFSSQFCGVGVYGTNAYFGFYSYDFGKNIMYVYNLETGRWSEGDSYPSSTGVSTYLDSATWGNCAEVNGVLYFAGKSSSGSSAGYPILKYRILPDAYNFTGWSIAMFLRQADATTAGMVKVSDEEIYIIGSTGVVTVFKVSTEDLGYFGKATMPMHGDSIRYYFVPAYANGKIYVAGGWSGAIGNLSANNYFDIFDVSANTWSSGPSMPYKVGNVWCIYSDGYIYALPTGSSESYKYSPYLKYDIVNETWSEITELGYNRVNNWINTSDDVVGNSSGLLQYFKYGDYIYGFNCTTKDFRRFKAVRSTWSAGTYPEVGDSWNNNEYLELEGNSELMKQGRYVQYKIQVKDPDGTSYVNNSVVSYPVYIRNIPPGEERYVYLKTNLDSSFAPNTMNSLQLRLYNAV